MSINAASTHSTIWNNAATALSALPKAPSSRPQFHPNDAGDTNKHATTLAAQGSNLLDALTSTTQAALIQLQGQH